MIANGAITDHVDKVNQKRRRFLLHHDGIEEAYDLTVQRECSNVSFDEMQKILPLTDEKIIV